MSEVSEHIRPGVWSPVKVASGDTMEHTGTRVEGLLSSEYPISFNFGELHVKRANDWRIIRDRSWVFLFESPCRGILEYHETSSEHHAWHQLFSRDAAIRALRSLEIDPRDINMSPILWALCPSIDDNEGWQQITAMPPWSWLGLYGFYERVADKAFYKRPAGYYWTSTDGRVLDQWIAITPSHIHPRFFSGITDDLFLSVAYPTSVHETISH